jgi:hypothetical protein
VLRVDFSGARKHMSLSPANRQGSKGCEGTALRAPSHSKPSLSQNEQTPAFARARRRPRRGVFGPFSVGARLCFLRRTLTR